MDVGDNNEVWLMLLHREKSIIPVAASAFQASQSTKRRLLDTYVGAIIVNRYGEVRVISDIDVVGIWGKSPFRKLLSLLSNAREIQVHFECWNGLTLEQFKALVLEYLAVDSRRGDPYLPQKRSLSRVHKEIRSASSFGEVFDQIDMPKAADALDVL